MKLKLQLRYLFHDRWILIKWLKSNNELKVNFPEKMIHYYNLDGWIANDVRRICKKHEIIK